MDSGCDYYGKDVCPADEICYMEEVEKSDYKNVTCMNKCEHFTSVQGHCTKNFIASGECVLIGEAHDPYPYCEYVLSHNNHAVVARISPPPDYLRISH